MHDWDYEVLERLGIPKTICQPIIKPGVCCGELKKEICEEVGMQSLKYSAVGSHDTASAFAAAPIMPGETGYAINSTGTWSLIGIELEEAQFENSMYEHRISNEGTIQGGFRPIKNIVGLWIIQECRKQWKREGKDLSYDEIDQQARMAPAFKSIIDPDDEMFFASSNMADTVKKYCKDTNQPIPESVGEIARAIYEGLAVKYAWSLDYLQTVKKEPITHLYMVGGGIQSQLLNEFTAQCTGRLVTVGPQEGACMGNVLCQAMALGEVKDIAQIREIVRRSSDIRTYEPLNDNSDWQAACNKMLTIKKAVGQ